MPYARATAVPRPTALLLNIGHALDHMFLLIFATAVVAIAQDFGLPDWESLMPYSVGAFMMFGIGSLPAGRLGDLWGRRRMMLIFFFGMAVSSVLVALTNTAWQLAIALTLLGVFSAIYHPIGIPMLVRGAPRPGLAIGINGLAGNLGVALAAITTGFLVKYFGWRMAFVAPAVLSAACGIAFAKLAPREYAPPAASPASGAKHPRATIARIFVVMTVAAITASLLFNFTTNGNNQLLAERFTAISRDPALLGTLLAVVYLIASFAQVAVGLLLDHVPLKKLYIGIVLAQAPLFALAAGAEGWALFALQIAFMIAVFGAIPFTDAMIVRYVDDRMRSRVSGMRLAVSFGVSSAAVWALGPMVKAAGFNTLLFVMAGIALVTLAAIVMLPPTPLVRAGADLKPSPPPQPTRAAD